MSVSHSGRLNECAAEHVEPEAGVCGASFCGVSERQLASDEELIQTGMRNNRTHKSQCCNVRVNAADCASRRGSLQIGGDGIEYRSEMIAIDFIGARQLQRGYVKQAHQFRLTTNDSHHELKHHGQNHCGIIIAGECVLQLSPEPYARQASFEGGPEEFLFGSVIAEESGFIHIG